MKIVEFIENRFQTLRIDESRDSKANKFSIVRDAETRALQSVLHFLRSIMQWLMVPKILGHWLMVNLHLAEAPQPLVVNAMREAKSKEKAIPLNRKAKRAMGLPTGDPDDTINPEPPAAS